MGRPTAHGGCARPGPTAPGDGHARQCVTPGARARRHRFARVVDREAGTVIWRAGADLDPIVIHGADFIRTGGLDDASPDLYLSHDSPDRTDQVVAPQEDHDFIAHAGKTSRASSPRSSGFDRCSRPRPAESRHSRGLSPEVEPSQQKGPAVQCLPSGRYWARTHRRGPCYSRFGSTASFASSEVRWVSLKTGPRTGPRDAHARSISSDSCWLGA